MTDVILLKIEAALVSIALAATFYAALCAYRTWKSNQSIIKKLDCIYKKLQDLNR